MKTTDMFGHYVTSFFQNYLVCERGVSPHTLRSYRDTFTLLVDFFSSEKHLSIVNFDLNNFNRSNITEFCDWLQTTRNCSESTRNQRLAAIHSFAVYMQYEDVTRLEQWQNILSIKFKKAPQPCISYLSVDGMKLLLQQIPTDTVEGRRDLAILGLLYDSAARVQELVDLTPQSLRLTKPYIIHLYGKGRKNRDVPLLDQSVEFLKVYMEEHHLLEEKYCMRPLFQNNRGEKFTTAGITYILQKYAALAREKNPSLIPKKLSPHCIRHTKAMHLQQCDVNIVYIRDFLGHVSIQTTEVYAKADSKSKREALAKAYQDVLPTTSGTPSWEKDEQLRTWLKSLC